MRAADATVSSVLDRAFVDAAFVDRPGGTPDLLTLALDEATFGLVHVDLLRRDSTWAIEAEGGGRPVGIVRRRHAVAGPARGGLVRDHRGDE